MKCLWPFLNSFFDSSSCLSAFLLFWGLGALFLRPAPSCACSFVFLHGVDSKAYLAAALWCCGFVRLSLWSWGPVVAHTFHSFPFFFHAGYISLFLLSYCPLGLWVLISMVRWFCISAIMQFTVLLVFGFVLSCFRGTLAGVSGSYNFVSVRNTNRMVEGTKPITHPIKRNKLPLFSRPTTKTVSKKQAQVSALMIAHCSQDFIYHVRLAKGIVKNFLDIKTSHGLHHCPSMVN